MRGRGKGFGFGGPQFSPGPGRYTEEENWLEGRWMWERVERMERLWGLSFSSAPKEVWPTSGGVGEDGEREKNTPSTIAPPSPSNHAPLYTCTLSSARSPCVGSDRPGVKSLGVHLRNRRGPSKSLSLLDTVCMWGGTCVHFMGNLKPFRVS